jgi:hypothetical protein
MRTIRHLSPLPPVPAEVTAGSPLPPATAVITACSPLPPDPIIVTSGPPLPRPGRPGENAARAADKPVPEPARAR